MAMQQQETDRTLDFAASPKPVGLAAGEQRLAPEVRRVLVVDHDIASADMLAELLENTGYRVEVATDGKYGLMLVESFNPQVIMLSTELPGLGSTEMTQILRGAPPYAARMKVTRIIYLADNLAMIKQRFHQMPGAAMSAYIFKPLNPTEVIEKVERAFAELRAASEPVTIEVPEES